MPAVVAPGVAADDKGVKLFRSRAVASAPPVSAFGEWVVRRLTPETPTAALNFAQLEQVLSNAASLICGAVYDDARAFLGRVLLDVPAQHEAMIIAKRTADGFQASLDDRDHVVLAWPWDHLATRVAWLSTRAGTTAEPSVGEALFVASVTYTLMHRQQLDSVFALWAEIAAGFRQAHDPVPDSSARSAPGSSEGSALGSSAGSAPGPGASLPRLDTQLFEAFLAVTGAPG